jgi:hypothetical protein
MDNNMGWVKIYRQIENWEWYKTPNMAHLFQHLIMKANHETQNWQGITIERGQLVTGRKALKAQTGLSEQSVRTCLNKLKSTGEITIKTTSRFSVITICNYGTYQDQQPTINQEINQQSNQQLTNNQPTTNHKQECKELKNDKKVIRATPFVPPTTLEVSQYAESIQFKLDAPYFVDHYTTRDWRVGKNKMKDWRAAVRTWRHNEKIGIGFVSKNPQAGRDIEKEMMETLEEMHNGQV